MQMTLANAIYFFCKFAKACSTSPSSGKRPTAAFEKISVPSTTTSN